MAEIKYLDLSGLSHYDGKIKSHISAAVEGGVTGLVSEITSIAIVGEEVILTYKVVGDETAKTVTLSKADLKDLIGEVSDSESGLMIAADKTKLDGIAEGAQVNVVEGISLNGHAFEIGADKIASAEMTFDWEAEGSDSLVLKIGEIEIGKIDTTKFVKDGIVSEAELITIPDDEAATVDRPAGKYIKISWSGDAGTDPTYINVTDLVDIHNVIGDDVAAGELVKVHTEVTGSGTSMDPWKVSAKLDETALVAALDTKIGKDDVMLDTNNKQVITFNAENGFSYTYKFENLSDNWELSFKTDGHSNYGAVIIEELIIPVNDETKDKLKIICNNGVISVYKDNVLQPETAIFAPGSLNIEFGDPFVGEITLQEDLSLNTKSSIEYLNDTKAYKTEVESSLNLKADKTEVTLKADKAEVEAALDTKIGKEDGMIMVPSEPTTETITYSGQENFTTSLFNGTNWNVECTLNHDDDLVNLVNLVLLGQNDAVIKEIGYISKKLILTNDNGTVTIDKDEHINEQISTVTIDPSKSYKLWARDNRMDPSSHVDVTITQGGDDTTLNTQESLNYLNENKADKAEVESSLALKADKTEVESSLALKADKTEVESSLALKADKTSTENAISNLEDTKIGKDDEMLIVSFEPTTTNTTTYSGQEYFTTDLVNGTNWTVECTLNHDDDSINFVLLDQEEVFSNELGGFKQKLILTNVNGTLTINKDEQIRTITIDPSKSYKLYALDIYVDPSSHVDVTITQGGDAILNTQKSISYLNENKADKSEVEASLEDINNKLAAIDTHEVITTAEIDALFS